MRKIEVVKAGSRSATDREQVPHCRVEGAFRCEPASPPGVSIWMDRLRLDAGTSIRWAPPHGDEALFVERGELAVLDPAGGIAPAGGAIVIEAQAGPTVEARAETWLLHMGAREDGTAAVGVGSNASSTASPTREGRSAPRVHVIGPRGTFEALEPGRETRFFADATCPTCSLWLLYTARSFAYESPVHSHSRDELIHVLRGEIRIGSLAAGPGDSIFIAADQPYRFHSGPEGFAFLNYRRSASEMTIRTTGERIVENGAATGMARVVDSFAGGLSSHG